MSAKELIRFWTFLADLLLSGGRRQGELESENDRLRVELEEEKRRSASLRGYR